MSRSRDLLIYGREKLWILRIAMNHWGIKISRKLRIYPRSENCTHSHNTVGTTHLVAKYHKFPRVLYIHDYITLSSAAIAKVEKLVRAD